eukprot:TRINITY_DN21162_c0_g1_i2.p1 TRINITY_DN21162_c0_g1~~TRINITY_DN21162_c0_g1_i2.p1  ORF type:complete len:232 (-),score=47.49 TRINITY_DN21162_c0_g1_i2:157-852(-)
MGLLLPGKRGITIRTVQCYHTTDDIGYVLCERKSELVGVDQDAQAGLNELRVLAKTDKSAGRRIGEMKKQGRLENVERVVPRLAYLLDTTIQVFERCPACCAGDAAGCEFGSGHSMHGVTCGTEEQMAAQLDLIWSCNTVVVECSFIGAAGMSESESVEQSIKRGHAGWAQLKPHVLAHPDVKFVLCHFSKRYSDEEIRDYFIDQEGGCPVNVVLWLDSGILDGAKLPSSD